MPRYGKLEYDIKLDAARFGTYIYQQIFDGLRLVDDKKREQAEPQQTHIFPYSCDADQFSVCSSLQASQTKRIPQYPKRSRSIGVFGSMMAVSGLQHPKSYLREENNPEKET